MTPWLETSRLILRPLELADAERTQVLFPKWEIVQYLTHSVPWPYPEQGALAYYRDVVLPAVARGAEWHWSLRLKSAPDELIVCICLIREGDNNRGFWLGIPWHRKGLMTEAVEAVTRFWFEDLRLPVLRVAKAIPNAASRRISQRAGMRVIAVEEKDYVSGRFPSETWEITREEWQYRLNRAKDNSSS